MLLILYAITHIMGVILPLEIYLCSLFDGLLMGLYTMW
jgi:hypothetical protein